MPFKRGESGNPKGRQAGSANKTTAEIREQLKTAFGDTLERLPDKLKVMEYEKQIELLKTFLPYILPKPIETPERNLIAEAEQAEAIRHMVNSTMRPPDVTFVATDFSKPPDV